MRGFWTLRAVKALALAAGISLLGTAVQAAPTVAPPWTVVARHLDNPHGVAFMSDGTMIVTESGHSGDVCLKTAKFCFGFTSKITSIDPTTGDETTLADGLLSAFFPFAAFGLGGVSVLNDRIFTVMGLNPQAWGNPKALCKGDPSCTDSVRKAKQQSGLLLEVDPAGGGTTTVSHIGAFNYNFTVTENPSPGNPDFQPGDADPYGLLAQSEGTYVADGGANTLSLVDPSGTRSVLVYVPDPPNHKPLFDAVPTCVAKAGDAVYVGTLIGKVFKWQGGQLTEVDTGGKTDAVVGCTSDAVGNLYFVNLADGFRHFNPRPSTGSVVKLASDGTSSYVVTPSQGLNYPNGIAFGTDGKLYLTINSICPSPPGIAYKVGIPKSFCPHGGQVVRLEPAA